MRKTGVPTEDNGKLSEASSDNVSQHRMLMRQVMWRRDIVIHFDFNVVCIILPGERFNFSQLPITMNNGVSWGKLVVVVMSKFIAITLVPENKA